MNVVSRKLLVAVSNFLNTTGKALVALAAIGAAHLIEPGHPLPNRTPLVIVVGVFALLDALAFFGVFPELVPCTGDEPCDECLQFVEKNGFHPYAAAAHVDPYDYSPAYTDEEGLR